MNKKLATYLGTANNILSYVHPTELPEVSVYLVSSEGELAQDIVDKVNSQTHPIKYVSIVTHGYTEEQIEILNKGITNGELRLTTLDDEVIVMGESLNTAIKAIDGDDSHLVLNMTDSDTYYPNYVKQMVNTLLIFGAEVAVITDPIIVTKDKKRCGWLYPHMREKPKPMGLGSTLIFKLSVWKKIPFATTIENGCEIIFQSNCLVTWQTIATAPPFNYAGEVKSDSNLIGLKYSDIQLSDVTL